jgi:hypothetical protein
MFIVLTVKVKGRQLTFTYFWRNQGHFCINKKSQADTESDVHSECGSESRRQIYCESLRMGKPALKTRNDAFTILEVGR